jgi:putative ABC transport system permease protein
MVGELWQDLRFGARTLLRSRGFATVSVVTLALGLGANSAIFSVVNGVVLRPLPYDDPQDLVWIREVSNRGGLMPVAWPNYQDWREQTTTLSGVGALSTFSTTVLGGEEPAMVSGAAVGEDFWKVFPVQPHRGRLTVPPDHLPGAPLMVLVSRSFWQNELGGRALDALSLELLGETARVVGVLPDGFDFPAGTQIWGPAEPFNTSTSRTAHNWDVVGRLARDGSVARALEEIDAITKRGAAQAVDEDPDFLAVGASVVPLSEQVVGGVRRPLLLLLGAAGLVLLLACVNLASTLLARGTARERELAVRASLGAGRGRIARQLLAESVLLATIGGAAGVALAYAMVQGVHAASPPFLPRLSEVEVDAGVLAYSAGVALVTALLFGLLPAWRLSRQDAAEALRSGSRGNALDHRGSTWRVLVSVEVALALVLLVASGLLVRSFQSLLAEEIGFDAEDVVVAPVSLSQIRYPAGQDQVRFYEALLEELEASPGVSAAGLMSTVPLHGPMGTGRIELDGDLEKHAVGGYVVASAGAFRALGIPLLQGRLFEDWDRPDTDHVALVSRSFAQQYWPGEDPIGRQVSGGGMDDFYRERVFARVVGVVGDVRHRDLGQEALPTVYFPYTQRPFRIQFGAGVVVKAASGSPERLVPLVRRALQAADPDVPVRIRTLGGVVRESLGERRFVMVVLGGFGLTALVLAGVGIFGVVSYSVARRSREMGIRLALGARPGTVRGSVVRGAMGMVAVGLTAGLAGTFVLSRTMQSLLYEVSPTDPLAVVVAVALLVAVGLLASWLPARAGTRVDPMVTMKAD